MRGSPGLARCLGRSAGGLPVAVLLCLGCASAASAGDFAHYRSSFGEGALNQVQELAMSADAGSVVLSDAGQVRRYSLDGQVLGRLRWVTLPLTYYSFNPFLSLACGPEGDVYVAVDDTNTLTRLAADGTELRTIGGAGSGPGQFSAPAYLAVAPDGSIYVADFDNNRVQHFTAELDYIGEWQTPPPPDEYSLVRPEALAVDHQGRVWVAWAQYRALEHGGNAGDVIIYDPVGTEISRFPVPLDFTDYYVRCTNWLFRDVGFDSTGRFRVLPPGDPDSRKLLSFDETGAQQDPLPLPRGADGFAVSPDGSLALSGWRYSEGVFVERLTLSGESLGRWGDYWWTADNDLLIGCRSVCFDPEGRVLVDGWFLFGDVGPADYYYLHRYTQEGTLDAVLYHESSPEVSNLYFAVAPDGAIVRSTLPISIDRDGNRYTSDRSDYDHCKVTKTDPSGVLIAEWDLGAVGGICVGMDGFLYAQRCVGVSSGYENRYIYQIEKYDLEGRLLGYWQVGGYGGLQAVDPGGRVYMSDNDMYAVHYLKQYSPTGELLGEMTAAGPEVFSGVGGVAITEDGLMAVLEGERIHLFQFPQCRFPDIPWWQWAAAHVEAVAKAGVVHGYSDGLYHPDRAVTRDQMAVYMARALAGGEDGVPRGPLLPTFWDVSRHHWAYKYIEYCHTQGVVGGYRDGYHPGKVVNRAQMAVFVARAMVGGDENVPAPEWQWFPDVPSDYWAYDYIGYCREHGVVSGYGDGLYHPERTVDRAQMAVYAQRAFDLPM